LGGRGGRAFPRYGKSDPRGKRGAQNPYIETKEEKKRVYLGFSEGDPKTFSTPISRGKKKGKTRLFHLLYHRGGRGGRGSGWFSKPVGKKGGSLEEETAFFFFGGGGWGLGGPIYSKKKRIQCEKKKKGGVRISLRILSPFSVGGGKGKILLGHVSKKKGGGKKGHHH